MDYRDYYKEVSSMATDLMEGKKVMFEEKEQKGFLPKPKDTSEETETNPIKIVAEYMSFFRKDAIDALEEVGVDADFIKGDIAKKTEGED